MELLFISCSVVFLLVCVFIERQFKKYIQESYPDIWQALSREYMGVKAYMSRPIAINQSIRFGELSQKNDKKIKHHIEFQNTALILLVSGLVAYSVIS